MTCTNVNLWQIHRRWMDYNPYALINYEHPVAPNSPLATVREAVSWLYARIILHGLARLYVHGPSIGGVGGWQGQSPEQICSKMTHSPEEFWVRNISECQRLISQNFYSWIVLLEVMVYFLAVYKISGYCWRKIKALVRS